MNGLDYNKSSFLMVYLMIFIVCSWYAQSGSGYTKLHSSEGSAVQQLVGNNQDKSLHLYYVRTALAYR